MVGLMKTASRQLLPHFHDMGYLRRAPTLFSRFPAVLFSPSTLSTLRCVGSTQFPTIVGLTAEANFAYDCRRADRRRDARCLI